MSFEIQELSDIIRVVALINLRLINLSKGISLDKSLLKQKIDKVCANYACVEVEDMDRTLNEMASEGLLIKDSETVQLSEQGVELGKEWQGLLLKKEPIMRLWLGWSMARLPGSWLLCQLSLLA